jgi:hypothetical protein
MALSSSSNRVASLDQLAFFGRSQRKSPTAFDYRWSIIGRRNDACRHASGETGVTLC